jgi:hypothetical protein
MKLLKRSLLALAVLAAGLIVLRLNAGLVRPAYPPGSILANPAGTCALVEYQFRGGERWHWLDPYALFVMADGDAFYLVKEIGSGKVLRDSAATMPAIPALSLGLAGMGDSVFYWSKDGSSAAFPGGEGPYHEWTGIEECSGPKRQSDFSSLACSADNATPACAALRAKI